VRDVEQSKIFVDFYK